MHALRIENTSESNARSFKTTLAVAKKAQKKFWSFNGIRIHDLRDIGAMLYQLSYEASPEVNQFLLLGYLDSHRVITEERKVQELTKG